MPDATPTPAGIVLTRDEAVAVITIDLAQPKNAFRTADAQRLSALLDEVASTGARCLVLRGARAAFSAGWDIASFGPQDDPAALIVEVVGPLLLKLRALPLPTLAAVAGPALGFGFGLALACDLCIAEESAAFGSPFRHIGMLPDSGTHHVLLNRLGYPLAAELICTGRLLSGTEAAALRLVNRAVDTGTVVPTALGLAHEIASGPTQAFRLSKELLQQGGDYESMLQAEGQKLKEVFRTPDLAEGIQAFQQRRKPVFTGRPALLRETKQ